MTKKICYTAIIGDYDSLKDPEVITPDWQYLCFTDNANLVSNIWEIVVVEKDKNVTPVKMARTIKACPYLYLPDHEYSVWVDASILIKCNLDDFIKHKILVSDIAIMQHPERKTIDEEAIRCIELKKDNPEILKAQIIKYENDGYPFNNGLVATGIIIRRDTEKVRNFCELWDLEIKQFSHRDQISFNYVLWKLPIHLCLFDFGVLNNRQFMLGSHK
jgi:hypothetical protein